MDTSQITPTANRATALALTARSGSYFGLRAGYRGDQWAIGTAHALTSNGFIVLATDAPAAESRLDRDARLGRTMENVRR